MYNVYFKTKLLNDESFSTYGEAYLWLVNRANYTCNLVKDYTIKPDKPVLEIWSCLPLDPKDRKALPVFTGPVMYFPDALLLLADICKKGNDQHNPGEPLHWAREKSTDQMDCAMRHMMDHGLGNTKDTDGMYHLGKAAWRLLAELQLTIEKDRNAAT